MLKTIHSPDEGRAWLRKLKENSRKPWLLSVISAPGLGRRACALPKSPTHL